jgi:hypothetical protein
MNTRAIILFLIIYSSVMTAVAIAYYVKYNRAKAKVNAKVTQIVAAVNTSKENIEELYKNESTSNKNALSSIKENLNDIIAHGISSMLVESDEDKASCITSINKFCEKKMTFMSDIFPDQKSCVQAELRSCGENGIPSERYMECAILDTKEKYLECHKTNLKRTILAT